MAEKIALIWPEITLFITTCVVMILGLSPNKQWRSLCLPASMAGLAVAGVLAAIGMSNSPQGDTMLPNMPGFVKVVVAVVGLMLILLQSGLIDRREEALVSAGRTFSPLRTNRAEYFSLVLFSLTGLMLCASAGDLIWLFLALELTSLPTYVMVAMSSSRGRAQEAGVKYFYLGALGAATFLYGFVMLYGGTGTLKLDVMAGIIAAEGINNITMIGLLLSIAGLAFKIAAVPMHFYTADVYQGAAAPVTAFLAFVPKTAGFVALLLICSVAGWSAGAGGDGLPEAVRVMLWVMAAVTMTVGNVLAILQNSVKRMLAYSSIAHSGYMLVGVLAGPGDGTFAASGVSAVLFYLAAYGVTNTGAFAVIACLEKRAADRGEPMEVEDFDDLRGLWRREPALGVVLAIVSLSLLGFPPLLGFMAKLPLFTAGIAAGEIALVVILGVNSAIAAFYYLRLVKAAMIDDANGSADSPDRPEHHPAYGLRFATGAISAVGVVVLAALAGQLAVSATNASIYAEPMTAGDTGGLITVQEEREPESAAPSV
ncbi:MAG: NADH-quinone oxidoreductase subunit N [Phycisphaerales bacterium]|jgi:NADH-quinone oxidoreductase subunit N